MSNKIILVSHKLSDWAISDIRRLVSQAQRDEAGEMPVIRDKTHYEWIGAAHAHLKMLLESIDQ